jgi:hypothetical protein
VCGGKWEGKREGWGGRRQKEEEREAGTGGKREIIFGPS